MREIRNENLVVKIFETRDEMGEADARDAAAAIRRLLAEKESVNILFAAAPSQNELLAALNRERGIEWNRVNAFHMDEYIGLPPDAPQGFGNFLKERIFDRQPFKAVYYIGGISDDPQRTCGEYARLLRENPPDFGFFGIGENGHIAFNDPPVAFFDDPQEVKIVELDPVCRRQQVNDGCFASLDLVPRYAVTLTIPTLMRIPKIFCTVPTKNKAQAIRDTVYGEISTACPASILRRHPDTTIYVDADGASLLKIN